jgi:hypothetical protein
MLEGLLFLTIFLSSIAESAKTGHVNGSPYNFINFKKIQIYNDKSNVRKFLYLSGITFVASTILALLLYGFDPSYFVTAIVWAAVNTLFSAYGYWCLFVVKVKDNK